MSDTKYTEAEINWAMNELKKKHPERANREQAIKLLDTMKSFAGVVVDKIEQDNKSEEITSKNEN